MAIKDILVYVDGSAQCATRIDLALAVARRFDAHLTGLYVTAHPYVSALELARAGGSGKARRGPDDPKFAAAAADLFRQRAAAAAEIVTEWRGAECDEDDIEKTIQLHARYADFLIIGQDVADHGEAPARRNLAARLVMDLGRPVLVVPFAGRFATVGERVLIAWNGSREATRAVNDALPILQKADEVTVMSINPRIGNEDHGDVPGADLALHPARHGVKVEVRKTSGTGIEISDMLLSRAQDLNADLLVAGAYSRSRLREDVLGGVTHDVFDHMTLPVFMAH